MFPPMCPRPTKPIPVVVVAIHALPSIVATSSSSSSRFAAARMGSTWSGRRKPAIAPSTARLRSVQATATAPGVASWRSATAPRRSTSARCSERSGSRKRASCLRRAQQIAPVETLQPQYSLIARDVEATILPFAEREGIGRDRLLPDGLGDAHRSHVPRAHRGSARMMTGASTTRAFASRSCPSIWR